LAKEFGVSATSVWKCANGVTSLAASNAKKPLLTPVEEELFLAFVEHQTEQYLPWTHTLLEEKVKAVLSAHPHPPTEDLGKQWTHQFIEWHLDKLSMY
jgi:hypothetical protein